MNTDSIYLAMSGDSLDEIVRPEMKQAYEADKKNWLATDKFSERTPGLFKPQFVGTRGMWLTAKCQCYLVQNETLNENKYSCKNISQEHNYLHFQCYKNVLDVFLKTMTESELEEKDIDKAKNVGFGVYDQGVATYEQNKLGLSGYEKALCFDRQDSYEAVRLLNQPKKFFITIQNDSEKSSTLYILCRNCEDCATASERKMCSCF